MKARNKLIAALFLAFAIPTAVNAGDRDWCRSPIDSMVQRRHADEGVAPAVEASRRTLIRRLSLDLVGLPPSPSEVAEFVNDSMPDAYERLVDRLLASPHFGERMAQFWLDLARYADSDGYHDDTNRAMWPYRDWVIDAFNTNQPFDEFTIEQLAGDLLPHATIDQMVATAFLRNGPTTSEDGADPDEYRARYAVDRVNTMSQVWLGLTVQCAECHDHKYDAISTREYYQLFAFFNQSPEQPLYRGLYAPPSIAVPNARQAKQLREFAAQIDRKEEQLAEVGMTLSAEFEGWKAALLDTTLSVPEPQDMICEFRFEGEGEQQLANTGVRRKHAKYSNSSEADRPQSSAGVLGRALRFTGDGGALDLGQLVEFRTALPFTVEAWVAPGAAGGAILSKIDANNNHRGFDVQIVDGRVVVRLVDEWPDAAIQVSSVSSFAAHRWLHLSVTYDGSASAEGVYLHVNGEPQDLSGDRSTSIRTIRNRVPLVLGGDEKGGFDGLIDEVRFYKWPLTNQQLLEAPLRGFREMARVEGKRHDLPQLFFRDYVYPHTAALRREIEKLRSNERRFAQQIPRLRVMRDQQQRRATHVLVRGDFRSLGEEVRPNTPSLLPPIDQETTGELTRLDLVRWMVGSNQRQTSRVTVNRLWALFFDRGIVPTLDDFGVQGELASHPELLEWLREEFVRSDWDVKLLIRRIVLSATYRQSSAASRECRERDPDNALLTRGPRHRLPAEILRDNALAISGLMSGRIGGPSVRPYQPAGLWREMSKGDEQEKVYIQSHGEDLYRRGIYTFWKRSIHYPTFAVLDAPNREVCTSARSVTNTPTQALSLLNDPAFVEMSRAFAALILDQSGVFPDQLEFAFQRAVARSASPQEIEALRSVFESVRESFTSQPSSAAQLRNVGESEAGSATDPVQLASWTAIAQIILTMDETISRE